MSTGVFLFCLILGGVPMFIAFSFYYVKALSAPLDRIELALFSVKSVYSNVRFVRTRHKNVTGNICATACIYFKKSYTEV